MNSFLVLNRGLNGVERVATGTGAGGQLVN